MWIVVIRASASNCASLVFTIFILFDNIVSSQKRLRADEKTFRGLKVFALSEDRTIGLEVSKVARGGIGGGAMR